MAINSVEIHDFQSIKKVKLDFASKPSGGSVTTIVGPSSTGKSAMLRALKMLMRNTSSAPVRIQEGAAKTTVSADFDGTPIRVERGKSLSTYFVGTEKYTKAGTSVPQPVKDVLKLDDSSVEIHTGTQFDKPYLLDESGTTVSSVIGKLTHANTLRLAVKEGNRRSLEANRLLKTRTEDLEKVRVQVGGYNWVHQAQMDVSSAKEIISKYKNIDSKVTSVKGVATRCSEYHQKYTEASQKALEHPDISSQVETSDKLLKRCMDVYSILTIIEDKKYFAARLLASKPQTLDTADIDAVDSHYKKITQVQALVESINKTLKEYKTLTGNISKLKEAAADVQEVFDRTLRRVGRCPLCGADHTGA